MISLADHPYINLFDTILKARYAFMGDVVRRGLREFGQNWAMRFEKTLATLYADETSLEQAVKGYVEFSVDAMKLHKRFEKERVYLARSYAEAAALVYHNPEYMRSLYLPGILISHFLWPHHYRQFLFFEGMFLAEMRRQNASSFFDVGIGTGYYSRILLEAQPDVCGIGFDVSESSRDFTLNHLRHFGLDGRYEVTLGDITAQAPGQRSDWLVSVEVLEHLEDPLAFLRALKTMLSTHGKAFVTAALNAPNADHIYLYRSPSEVVAQLEEAGFAIEQYQYVAAYKPKKPGLPVPELAAFIIGHVEYDPVS